MYTLVWHLMFLISKAYIHTYLEPYTYAIGVHWYAHTHRHRKITWTVGTFSMLNIHIT